MVDVEDVIEQCGQVIIGTSSLVGSIHTMLVNMYVNHGFDVARRNMNNSMITWKWWCSSDMSPCLRRRSLLLRLCLSSAIVSKSEVTPSNWLSMPVDLQVSAHQSS